MSSSARGIHMANLAERLGIADAIQARVTRPETDIVSEMVARGEVELGIVVITQILTTPGVTLVGPLPAEVQAYLTFTAAVSKNSSVPDAARQLIAFLTGPLATPVISRQGMEPMQAAPRILQEEVRKLQLDAIRVLWADDSTRVFCITSNSRMEDADSSFLAELGPAQRFRPRSACSMPGRGRVITNGDGMVAVYVQVFAPGITDSIGQARVTVSLQNGRSGMYYCDSRKQEDRWARPVCRKVYDY